MRTSLKFEDWPAADRAMWERLTIVGDPFDSSGPPSTWAAETRRVTVRDYGYWLSFVLPHDPGRSGQCPSARIRPDLVRLYCRSMEDVSARTRSGRIARLLVIARGANPQGKFEWLAEIRRALDRRAIYDGPVRCKQSRLRPSSKLVDAGLSYADQARSSTELRAWKRARQFCDGVMIALIAARPLRIKNFANLRLGSHLLRTSSGFLIDVPGSETKTGCPIELPVPDELCPWLDEYMACHRPILLAGRQSDHVWLTAAGRAYRTENLSQRFAYLTERLVGAPISAHLFRDCAATTIATEDPEHIRIIGPLLGHTSLKTSESHYNHAQQLQANRRVQDCIRQKRELARPLKRRPLPT